MYRLPSAASAPEFRSLLEYWLSKFPAKVPANSDDDPRPNSLGDAEKSAIKPYDWLPGRQHIDPAEFPPRQMAQLLLFDVVAGPAGRRFRFRVAGTAFATLAGRDVTGMFYDELGPPERIAPVIAALNLIVERRAPVFLEGRLTVAPDDHFWVKRLGVPLARDGRHVDMVLALWLAERRALRRDQDSRTEGSTPILLERV